MNSWNHYTYDSQKHVKMHNSRPTANEAIMSATECMRENKPTKTRDM
jgi:hypothetical protein